MGLRTTLPFHFYRTDKLRLLSSNRGPADVRLRIKLHVYVEVCVEASQDVIATLRGDFIHLGKDWGTHTLPDATPQKKPTMPRSCLLI